jgi:membrane protein DedA with SNARE-associated domain
MADAILAFISHQGYLGVFILMVVENLFPPIPSEIILPFIGHLSATGELSLLPALLVATLGAVVGTSLWFVLGWVVPVPVLERFFRRFGGYVAIDVQDFKKATNFFTKYELQAIFFGRMLPAVRSVISIPAGCVRMRVSTFLLLSTIGAGIWNTGLILFGYYFLNDYEVVSTYMSPVADVIITLFIVVYVLQVVRFVFRRVRHGDHEEGETAIT